MPTTFQASLWSQMAEDARKVAGRMNDPTLRLQMQLIAAAYDVLAMRAEDLAAAAQPSEEAGELE